MIVRVLVSVATIDSERAHVGMDLPPRKYVWMDCCFLRNRTPNRVMAIR